MWTTPILTTSAELASAARDSATLLRWWDDLDTEGCGGDAVRVIAQELRPLREGVVATPDRVREIVWLAHAWGFSAPAVENAP